ncbi:MAG: hypothetical protein ACYTGZ_08340 [Planctomycetota bacterium]|jgi:uncharacterized membrane protein (Fun14 family)
MAEKPTQSPQEQAKPLVWRRRLVVIVILIVGAGIAGRMLLPDPEPAGGGDGSGMRTGLVASDGEPVEREETFSDKLKKLLPYVTEAGMALLLGMILGIGTRMAIKTVVMVVIVGVVGLQFAIYKGWMSAGDAGGFVKHLTEYVFNVPEGVEGTDYLLEKAPTGGAGLLGFMMGLKKG